MRALSSVACEFDPVRAESIHSFVLRLRAMGRRCTLSPGRCIMAQLVAIELEMTGELAKFRLPQGVQDRLQFLLDKQDEGTRLTDEERREAEGLVELAEFLTLLKLRTGRTGTIRQP